ncbi:MAG: Mut7-C ubiquitin/RNAse domain-containing protein [Candidatus Aegiribacteria sp.]|nr:Mut7-C ubiquitin/RNAse domain-containing protein [Candidatus Aegiribacteria sp.]
MSENVSSAGSVTIRAYAELNDFLPKLLRYRSFSYPLNGGNSLKHLIESAGIPHTEIELILINGSSVGLEATVNAEDRISVYPVFESIDVTPLIALRPEPLRKTRFILDVHLGKLALILRLLGFDAKFPGDIPDEELAQISADENRILLTRDTMLLKRNIVTHGCWLHSQDPEEQAGEILQRLDLRNSVKPFTRCLDCGAFLEPVSKERIMHRLEALTKKYYNEFSICTDCGKIYWKGSHYEPLLQLLERLNIIIADDGDRNEN